MNVKMSVERMKVGGLERGGVRSEWCGKMSE